MSCLLNQIALCNSKVQQKIVQLDENKFEIGYTLYLYLMEYLIFPNFDRIFKLYLQTRNDFYIVLRNRMLYILKTSKVRVII